MALMEKSTRPADEHTLAIFDAWTTDALKHMQDNSRLFGVAKDCFVVVVREGTGNSFRVATGNPVVVTFHGRPDNDVMGRALAAIRLAFDRSNGLEKTPKFLEFDKDTRKLRKGEGNPLSMESVSEVYNTLHPSEIEVQGKVTYRMRHKVTGEVIEVESESDAPFISRNNWNYMAQKLTQKVVALHGPAHVDGE
jgi:hypothetical protein